MSNAELKEKPNNILESFNYAIKGIIYVFKTQRSMRIHFLITFVVLAVSLFLNLSKIEFMILSFTIVLVLITEMLNTVTEKFADLFTDKYHALIEVIKDMAAGMVLLAAINAVIIGYLIFSRKSFFGSGPAIPVLTRIKEAPEYIVIICMAGVAILIIAGKAYFGEGTPLRGGMPSLHSAFAFSVVTVTMFVTLDVITTLLTFLLAMMVVENRVREGIHTKMEIAIGAVMGVLITILFFQVFG